MNRRKNKLPRARISRYSRPSGSTSLMSRSRLIRGPKPSALLNADNKKTLRIVLTGGHAGTTALSVVEELIRRDTKERPEEIYWLGTRKAIEGTMAPTIESKILPKAGVIFYSIFTGRAQRKLSMWTLPSLFKVPFGFFHSLFLLVKIKPHVILSFGGFAAFPVVVVGSLLKIPVIIHEQTAAAGLTNKLSAPLAKKIALARRESLGYYPKTKSVIVGNPIHSQILEVKPKLTKSKPPVVFVFCGSRGSQAVNKLISGILEELLKRYQVIHQTGTIDYQVFLKRKNSLPPSLANNYEVYDFIDPTQVDGIYRRSDIIIARAGANTVAEIMSVKRPAILIPLPHAVNDEQKKNALIAKKAGVAKIFPQEGSTSQKLLRKVLEVENSWEKMVKRAQKVKTPDRYAPQKLVDLIMEVV